MLKAYRPDLIFFVFSAVFAVLLFRSTEEAVICGTLYAALLGYKLSAETRPRDLFPLAMLFLFLIVLTQIPPRLFTASLIYTVRSLILFRALIVSLNEIQLSKASTPRSSIAWISALTVSLFASALLVYSTFRPVPEALIHFAHYFVAAPLMIIGTLFTPLAVPGVALGLLSLYLPLQWISVVLFVCITIGYRLWRPQPLVAHE